MTIHQAKGMQWPVVFIPALLRNRFPSARQGGRSIWHLIPKKAVLGHERYETNIEDERRLFYVAMTRSQKFLHMTWAPIARSTRYARSSEFWDDVLASPWVENTRPDYTHRRRTEPRPRVGISNVVLSFSDIKYFFLCPYEFKLRVLYGFNPPIDRAIGYGKSLHDALAEVHHRSIQGVVPTEEDVSQLVATHLHVPYAHESLREKLAASATEVLLSYLRKSRDMLDKIEFSEKRIELTLGDGISVIGRIDLVRRLDKEEVSIVDLKTSERSQDEDVTNMQLGVYALGYEELTGRRADYVEVYQLDRQKEKRRAVDDGLSEGVKKHVTVAAKGLRSGVMKPKATKTVCRSCDYRRLCSAGCRMMRTVQ